MKNSFAIAVLLGTVSATSLPQGPIVIDACDNCDIGDVQDAASTVVVRDVQEGERMMQNTTFAARETKQDMSRSARDIVRAIDDIQRAIPSEDISGKLSYTINTAPIKNALDLKKEFMTTDANKVENAVNELMGSPLRNAKLQVATQFAGVAGATFDSLQQQVRQDFPDGEKCQARPFYDCLQTLQAWERRGRRIFRTECAKANGCSIEQSEMDDSLREKTQMKWGQLAQSVAGEFQDVAQKQSQIIDGVGQKWMKKSAEYMKSDMKCDFGCVDQYMMDRRWTDYNEFDVMMQCPCTIPVNVQPVQDFEGADFYKMTHADFATILEDVAPAGDDATAPAGETKEEKVKRLAKEYADKAKKAGQEAKDKLNEASGGKAMYIIGGVAVVVLGGSPTTASARRKKKVVKTIDSLASSERTTQSSHLII